MSTAPARLQTVLVTVGSDHHPAHRLLRAVAGWARTRPDVVVIAQRGPVAGLDGLGGEQFLPKQQLLALMRSADVVVCTGGPATIAEVTAAGRRPVVVPRRARFGEVVDDHQVAYSRRLAADGTVLLVEDVADLAAVLDGALGDTALLQLPAGAVAGGVEDAHRRFRAVVEQAAAMRDPVRAPVLLLCGSSTTDTALLEQLVGAVPGVLSVGDLTRVWEQGVREDHRCTCGADFSTCPFWTGVGDTAFGGWDASTAEEAVTDARQVVRRRSLPAMATGVQRSTWRLRRHRSLSRYQALLRAAAAWSGASVVVATSSHVALTYLVGRGTPDVRCLVVAGRPGRGARPSSTDPVRRRLARRLDDVLLRCLPVLGVPLSVVQQEDLERDPGLAVRRALWPVDVHDVTTTSGTATSGTATDHRLSRRSVAEPDRPSVPGSRRPESTVGSGESPTVMNARPDGA